MRTKIVVVLSITLLYQVAASVPTKQDGKFSQRRKEMLDPQGKYWLEWAVNWDEETITFNITAETLGWVGFGLSNNGKMSGADVVIGGMKHNGLVYFSDRHAIKNQLPVEDPSQDWILLDCVETASHTFLSVKRTLDTCDPQDYPITENTVSVIWAYGETDKIGFHRGNRGSYNVYLLDPNWAPQIDRGETGQSEPTLQAMPAQNIPEQLETWTISERLVIPTNHTSYFCSMHKAPGLRKKHHVIGFDVHFADEIGKASAHHLDIYKCNIPKSGPFSRIPASELYGRHVGNSPETCFGLPGTAAGMQIEYCTEYFVGWTIGGRAYFNPSHVGFPLGNDDGEDEYYLMQVHYDNPDEDSNTLVDLRVDIFYTPHLREYEGGGLTITHEIPGAPESFLIPPNSTDHRIYGHCSSECTRRILGPGGSIKIIGALLHAHTSGVKMRMQHFRNGVELPWIIYDDNWSNEFQQIRNLWEEIEVLPGDQITVDCIYDSTWANGGTVVGGYATGQEMCLGLLFYYNRIRDYNICASEIVSQEMKRKYLNGVTSARWNETKLDFVVEKPEYLKGFTVPEVSQIFVDWNDNLRKDLQKEHIWRPHQGTCFRDRFARNIDIEPFSEGLSEDDFRGPVHYPLMAKAYRPQERKCPAH